MNSNEYLFPKRLTRRDFVKLAGAAAAAITIPGGGCSTAEPAKPTGPTIGTGFHTYEAQVDWGKLPEGMTYGFGCGVVVDSKDRVFVTSRSTNPCVTIFDKHGQILETWSKDFGDNIGYTTDQIKATAHCLYISKEHGTEYIYWTENQTGGKKDVKTGVTSPRLGARIYKTDIHGKVLYTIGNVEKEDSTSQKFYWQSPTDVAVSANGDIYVVDGYGTQKVNRFDKNFKLIKTIGGKGKEHGQFNTCHGIWINTLKSEPEVYIADRANGRVEVYSLELDYKRTILDKSDPKNVASDQMVRNPCCFYQHKGNIYIPDLDHRVTIIDKDDNVVAHLGDGKDKDGKELPDNLHSPTLFTHPHALTVDSRGDIYVVEWVDFGRPRKFKHVPQTA